ncbi:MAG: type 1 glutamine amidotransferase [Rhodobiaceae bacterium]|nr:type 1 glutamine amidotransferase [Rhodobiaceae bacterium]
MSKRFLILDGYDAPGRAALEQASCTRAGTLYLNMLKAALPDAEADVMHPADASTTLPTGAVLADYDAVLWTGSSLTIYHTTPEVTRQVELARAVYKAGVPSFGSCWALQMAALAAGGSCRLNPKGREFGVARKISLTDAGKAHPLYRGKSACFDGLTSHFDDVATLPQNTPILANNSVTEVQAAAVDQNGTSFWAVQYHPEYDLNEVAGLTRFRAEGLISDGHFSDQAALNAYVDELEALQADPSRLDLAWKLGIDQDVLDPAIRQLEFRNWLDAVVLI